MRSTTLSSQSVFLRTQSVLSPSSCSKCVKSRQFRVDSRFDDQTSKLSRRNPILFLFRYARQKRVNTYKEFRFLNCIACKATKLTNYVDYNDVLDESPSKKKLRRNFVQGDVPVSNTSLRGYLKFFLLFGLFTLEGTQQAIAGSDFASGLQSISFLGDLGDISTGFASAFLLIFFSELGDKTFFIAALLAARNSGAVVFVGTFGALAAMTIISVVLGRTFHYVDDILPFRFGDTDLPVDDIAAVCLLVYFGVSTLLDATSGDGLKAEEEQKEAELAVSEFLGNGAGILATANTVISTFLLVFVAEWGDKSFFSTIALAAASSPLGVIGGALAGHGVATLLAVLGGSLLGTFLSEKVIAYIGGVLFLVFAAVTLIEIVT
ncbi:GDT1-like protein 1, chloroplastic isoform X1 [Actinidia eriantha]|uniref:GDT1-like protein 1, chloroplastic isoform X1 n=1 Tax=Actinidia eriantha TaxID=165200 RepID=UPI002590547E|nr:GDT1-like protein 1, chloroplastic isoform X1 [Actinidia eriantha]